MARTPLPPEPAARPSHPAAARRRSCGSIQPEKSGSLADSAWIQRAPAAAPDRLDRFLTIFGGLIPEQASGLGFLAATQPTRTAYTERKASRTPQPTLQPQTFPAPDGEQWVLSTPMAICSLLGALDTVPRIQCLPAS